MALGASGLANPAPVRYPMGKGAKPAYSWWDGQKLGYIDARLQVYWSLYRDSVAKTAGFAQLLKLAGEGPVTLFDFDGYDHEAMGMSLAQVMLNDRRPMGHAFVLKAMLLYGPDVKPQTILDPMIQSEARLAGARP